MLTTEQQKLSDVLFEWGWTRAEVEGKISCSTAIPTEPAFVGIMYLCMYDIGFQTFLESNIQYHVSFNIQKVCTYN